MKTQFIVSLMGVAVSGLVLLFVAGRFLLRKYKAQPVSVPASVAFAMVVVCTGAFSGYKLLEASYHLAVHAADAGQELISRAVNFGSVSLLEGFGKTADHFDEKWRTETLTDVKALEMTVLSCTETKSGDRNTMHLAIGIKNTSDKPIDFNAVVARQHILLKDAKGMCYPLSEVEYDNSTLPPGKTSARQIDITLPQGISPTMLATPNQEIPLNNKS